MALTGTPVENRLTDLWSQMQFVEPGLLGSREAFEERYSQPIANGDELRAAELRQRIRPFLLRRKKAQVALDLPPRTELVERCELSDAERTPMTRCAQPRRKRSSRRSRAARVSSRRSSCS